ncbi:DgyrCDS6768 [Dimorphilus gyrociliatus]|uniref:DgyrCDS6768 n=1 Tax=Dimorphilus gyrociliatus TaxID=2664684 RepID=A0A7I8VQL5_9ANNE|nr:DgyrCDS6768 [Dimorphilus gyrociliatus]
MFCTKYLDFIQPQTLIITGDLTDAKHDDHMGSEQYLDEWQTYTKIVKNYCSKKTTTLDIRGNHDTFNVGGDKSSTNYYKNYSLRGNKLQSYYHRQGNVTLIALDVALTIGLKRPFNFFGQLDEKNYKLVDKFIKEAEKRKDAIVFFGHFPSSTVVGKKHEMKSLISKAGFYLCGHLHNLLGFLPQMYTSHIDGNMELELADWKDNRAYRIFAVDNGLFSFVDKTLFDEFPLVLITNPKHSQFNSPKILIFSPVPVDQVVVSVDGFKLGNAKKTNTSPLYTIPWDPKQFKTGIHKISVNVKCGGRISKHEQPFSLDNSRLPFPFRARFILMADHRLVARCWIRRLSILSADATLCYVLIGWSLYIYLGPWFVGQLIENHWGVVCFYGAFTYSHGVISLPTLPFFVLNVYKMLLSRKKPSIERNFQECKRKDKGKELPTFSEFIQKRDFMGAITLLEVHNTAEISLYDRSIWIAYCAFHLSDFKKAVNFYHKALKDDGPNPEIYIWLACTYFMLGMYEESREFIEKGPKTPLKNRLLFHLSQKFDDEEKIIVYHQRLQDITEDQLSLASMHYLRSHYEEAIDIYKRVLFEHKDYLAVHVYIALCYYKMDYYDISQEILNIYLRSYPDSVVAINLKACNNFRLFHVESAHTELEFYKEKYSESSYSYFLDVLNHNLVVFNSGQDILRFLPPLVNIIPEARLNLVIYYLQKNDLQAAFKLIKEFNPSTIQEYILKGTVCACLGQEERSSSYIEFAKECFKSVGDSKGERDSIRGRQCMASYYFLLENFNDVLIYLDSIKNYFHNDDTFNYNFAQALTAVGEFAKAEEVFLLITNYYFRSEYTYLSCLARSYIMNGKAYLAWELYLKAETGVQSFNLLRLIANDCYKTDQFYYSAKAFDILDRLDPSPEYWEGKRGACMGVFRFITYGMEKKTRLKDIIRILKNSTNSQAETIVKLLKDWALQNKYDISDIY